MEEKKLSEFLKENEAYESFIENCLNDGKILQSIENYSLSNIGISKGFTWVETSEGKEYWSDLYLNNLDNLIYDMDEILYKEYEKRNMKESSEQNPIIKDIVEKNVETKLEDSKTRVSNNYFEWNRVYSYS